MAIAYCFHTYFLLLPPLLRKLGTAKSVARFHNKIQQH